MRGQCEGCGAEAQITLSQWDERLCPACMTKYAIAYGAADHLRTLLKAAMSEWAETWRDHPHVTRHLPDEAAVLCREVGPDVLSARTGTRRNLKLKKTA